MPIKAKKVNFTADMTFDAHITVAAITDVALGWMRFGDIFCAMQWRKNPLRTHLLWLPHTI